MMMGLWLNLRRSLSKKSIFTCAKIPVPVNNLDEEKREIFTFPYGTKECVVYKQKEDDPTPKLPLLQKKGMKKSPSEASASSPTYSPSIESFDSFEAEDCEIIKFGEAMEVYQSGQKCSKNKLVEIRSRPSGRYGMFRDLWALRLAAFGNLDRNGGLPFSTSQTPHDSFSKQERNMNDSLIQVHLPFLENKELFGDYVNIIGGIRFGKIMEDLDVFAATCAYMHCGTSTTNGEKLTIVTAAVDRIDVHMRLDEPMNLRMKGMVTFVGKSSMEVTIVVESSLKGSSNDPKSSPVDPKVDQDVIINQMMEEEAGEDDGNGPWQLAALAKFIMVAKNSEGPVQVPRLKLNSEREEAIFAAGAERHATRLSRAQQSLFKEPPTGDESTLLHKLFLKPSCTSIEQVPISSTVLTTTKLCHPQERNIHDLIFGGFLMREAFELGFTCAQLFSHSRLHFLAVDELAFKHPVPIGAVLQLTSQVVYTVEEANVHDVNVNKSQLIHVEVVADVLNIQSGERKTTNTFHFTYRKESAPAYAVKPTTYAEAMKYLEGKRRISAAPLDPLGTIYKF